MEWKSDPKPEPREKKKPKRIASISDSKKIDLKLYKQARHEYLMVHTFCERCIYISKKDSRKCINPSDQIHHKKGRISSLLYNKKFFMACCDDCHKWIEANPKQSKLKGWSVSRLSL